MMLNKLHLCFILFFIVFTMPLSAQNYNMGSGTVNTCSGNFFDSGGGAGNYGNNENSSMTFCSSVSGSCIRLLFTTFDLETNADFLSVYDGSSTAAPLIGTYTGNTIPGIIVSGSGCLTIQFTSNGSGTAVGWQALISCLACNGGNCPVTCNGGPAPSNDACSGAQNLGLLPVPAACPGGIGGLQITNGSNLCATAEFPYTSLNGCQPSGNMASPASDVWYRFNITGPTLNISINGLSSPNVGLYEGTNCNNLVPRGCAVGNAGSLSTSFTGLAPGIYFLQVSGGALSDQCNYSMTLQNNFDCAGCVIQSSLTATPPPINGTYAAGQTVQFCYTITDYNQTSANWLHGMVPTFGPGWNTATLVPTPPANCSGSGTWGWYNTNITSSATGNVTGPGFYYESPLGNPFGMSDGNPGNNFGDNNGTNGCDWSFCWTIQTDALANCIDGTSLNISINTLGDGESGSWTSLACTQDPVTNFLATLSCCPAPIVNVTNPNCASQTTGSASVQGQGSAPYDYVWFDASGAVISSQNNLAGPSSLLGLGPGNYNVQVTDNNGCITNASLTIVAAPSFSVSMITNDLSCFGSNDGIALVNINGGSPGFTYSWSPSGSGSNPSNLPAGNYTVTVTDSRGCTATANGVISQPAQLNISTIQQTNVSCNGGQDGSLGVSTSGGTGPYLYSWSTGAAGSSISGLGAGNYTVTVTDDNGCTAFMMQVITQPAVINLALSSTNASCGNANGSASVVANGGTPGYSYSWSPSGGSAANASGLSAGGYVVTVTDSRGCTALGNVVVSNSSGPTANISAFTDVTCAGGNNGSATATVNGGAAPLVYSWTPAGGNGTSASGLSAGNYTFTVTDASGCTSAASVIISEPPQLTATITANIPASCSNENDGSLTVQANGGVPGYSYNWSGGSVNPTDNFLTPGNYTVTITDANGCTATASATVSAPAPLVLNQVSVFSADCNGSATGSATVDASGGTSPYNYLWSNGASGATASALASGTYTVTVTDNNGCTEELQIIVTEPSLLNLALSANGTTCGSSNGSASVVVNGGVGPYSYAWNPAGGTGSSASGLPSGNYTVIVTDANGCTAAGNVVVPSADGPVLALNNSTDISCPGGNDGSFDVSLNGGVLPYTIQWSHGSQGLQQSGLSAGTYVITVSDANGCNAALSITLVEPAAFSLNPSITDANCGQADGSIDFTVSGGTPGYAWLWSNGSSASGTLGSISAGTYTLTVTDSRGCTASAPAQVNDIPGPVLSLGNELDVSCQGGSDGRLLVNIAGGQGPYSYLWSNGANVNPVINIPAGTYTVTVTDANGCTATFSASVAEPPALQLNLSSTPATCGASNGSASVNVSGGSPGYSYNWIPSGGNASNASGLAAGSYTVEVTDNQGCTAQAGVSVPSSNGPSVAVLNSTDVSCNGGNDGSLTIAVNGGLGPYTYQWSSGGSGTSGSQLSAGNYTVTVTDANNCSSTATAIINEPAALALVTSAQTAHCGQSDGSADVVVNGGTAPYTYSWSTGTSSGSNVSGLPAGSYTVTITDNNGCTSAASVLIPDQAAPTIGIAIQNNVSCNAGSDGSVSVAVNGGNAPFSYSWSTGATTAVVSSLAAGSYTVSITDVNGCTADLVVQITEPAAIQLSFNTVIATCGNSNGSADVTPSGGNAPYTYAWSSGANVAAATNLGAGVYTVTVTGNDGCSVEGSVIVNSAGGPVISAGPQTDVSCFGGNDGSANVLVSSGNGPFVFDWLPGGATTATATGLAMGNYKVTVTDINGCSTTLNFDILEPPALQVSSLSTPASCFAGADGTASVDAQGGTAPYTYDWNPGGLLTASRIGLTAGTYDITVTDANGCSALTSVSVAEPPALSTLFNTTDASCAGGSNGLAGVVAGGGTAPYTFLWSNGDAGPQASSLTAGTYTVTITDNNGCTFIDQVQVGEAPAISIQANVTDATCGSSNGSLQVNVSGGTGAYGYVWSNGQNTSSLNGLASGTYTLVVTDANGCTAEQPITVADQGAATLALNTLSDASCNGSSDGSAEITVQNGQGPFSYQWFPSGGTAAQAAGLVAGSYTVEVSDANGCIASIALTIAEPPAIQLQFNTTQATCGNANGSAVVNISGGTGAFQYLWSDGSTGNSLNAIPSGIYTLTVTDANGCTGIDNVTVTSPSSLALTTSSVAATCFNGNDGSAEVIVNGGTAPYTYLWSNGVNSAQATGLSAGAYDITVTDADGCNTFSSVNVTQAPAISINAATVSATCGGSNGSAQVNVNGGTGALTLLWSTGDTGNNISNVSAGTYTLTVTDASGCTAGELINIGNLGGPTAAIQAVTDVSCFGGSDGSAAVNVSAGAGPFTYQWLPSGGAAAQAQQLTAGNYSVNVTDANGCISTVNVQVNEPALLALNTASTQSTCGNANGSAQVFVNGGTGAYQYLWSNGSAANLISGVSSGSYTVTVSDANGCTSVTTVAVPNAGGPVIAVNNVSPASCNGGANGSASVVVNSGNGPFLYNWLPAGGSAATATGLSAGNYSVQVIDVNGCISQQAIVIQEPAALALQSQASPSSCNAANGLASVNVAGGSAPYSYSWSNGSASDTAFALVTGIYDVTVTDANNCSATLQVNVPGLPGPSIDALQAVPVTCAGLSNGSVTTQCSNGTPPYTYSWSNGSSAAQLSAVPAGSYTFTVTDAFGCSAASTIQVTEPAPLQASGQALQMVRCFGGSDGIAEVTGNGGTAPYQALWSNGAQTLNTGNLSAGTYTLLLTDANGCTSTSSVTITEPTLLKVSNVQVQAVRCFGEQNGSINCQSSGGTIPYSYLWSTSDTTSSVIGLPAGTYALTITDANGCLADTSIQLNQPTPLAWIPVQAVNILCNGDASGSLATGANGSVAPYSYTWSTGGSGALQAGLTAGSYTVTVTDANGCTSQRSYTLTEPPALALQAQATMISCNGQGNGSISAVVSGGVNPYQLNWGNGTTGNSLNNLVPGSYTLSITDANGCKKDSLFIISEPPVLTASVAEPDTLCIGQSTVLQAQVNGGTLPYAYLWNTGGITDSLLVSPGLSSGYQVLITDANGCTFTVSDIAVNVFPPLSVQLSVTEDTLCFGEATSFAVQAAGGNGGPYTYIWNTVLASGSSFALQPDSTFLYTVTLSDACTVSEPSASQQVLVNPLPVVDFIPLNQDGCMPVTVNFASQSLTTQGAAYAWDFGDGNSGSGNGIVHTYTEAGTYDVSLSVTDTNGCFAKLERPAMIEVYPLPTAFFSTEPQKVSILLPQVTFLNGSSGALSSQWDFGDGSPLENEWSPQHAYSDTGHYRVELIVVSNDGCRDTFYNEIIVNGEITFYVPNAFTPNNDGNNDMFTGYGIGLLDVDFLIFDRWGKNIFRSNNLARGWDGTYYNSGDPCPEGTYVYLFRINVQGEDLPREYTGRVTLVR